MSIPTGTYKHYRGKLYQVYGVAKHSETGEQLVVYVPLYGEGGYWVRPLQMFTQTVEVNGKQVPRFEKV